MEKKNIIDLEKIFSQTAKELKGNDELIKQEFLVEIKVLAERWIKDKYQEEEEPQDADFLSYKRRHKPA